jgi:hypothetical protein
MNTKRNAADLDKLHAWSMVATKQISPGKARNFFLETSAAMAGGALRNREFSDGCLEL